MILESWQTALTPRDLYHQLSGLSARKLHHLTAAFLRRVWDDLPSDHTRRAVEATEKFVDGLLTTNQLARLRSTDLLDSCESLWIDPENGYEEAQLIGQGCICCGSCDRQAAEYECRAAENGYILDGVVSGVKQPEWIAVQAAFLARELTAWAARPENREFALQREALEQHRYMNDVLGNAGFSDPDWPEWRTQTVRLIARSIYRERTFDQLPILADALQDAGCDDEAVLTHCRAAKEHVRGCWVVDLAMGVS